MSTIENPLDNASLGDLARDDNPTDELARRVVVFEAMPAEVEAGARGHDRHAPTAWL